MRPLNFILLTLLTFSSCKSSSDKQTTFQADEDIHRKIDTTKLFEALPNVTKKLNMPLLQNGVDSFELRIWCPFKNGNLYSEQNIITIRYFDKAWRLTQTHVWEKNPEYLFSRNDTVNHLLDTEIDSSKTTLLFPKDQVQAFIDSLSNFNLLNAPRQDSISKTIFPNQDGYRFIFEIATKDSYRMIDYNCGSTQGLEGFHKMIGKLLDFLRRQLSIEIWHCN